MSTRRKLGHLTTVAALFMLFSVPSLPVMAQEPTPPPEDEPTESEEKAGSTTPEESGAPTEAEQVGAEEEIVVVGTQIKGADPVGSDPVVISHEEAVRTGLANTADIIRRLPQNQTAVGGGGDIGFQGGTANQGYNGAQMDTVNLRGLGPTATLILVDGRRVVGAGGAATSTDANQVPLPALERLEVLVDGASAVYGSDAVAGVVNFVLRRDFERLEATLRADDQTGDDQYGGSVIAGRVWEEAGSLANGNLLVTYERLDRGAFNAGEIGRLRQNLQPLGGPDLRLNADNASVGLSPNVITQLLGPNFSIPRGGSYNYFGVPFGNGLGLTAADLALNQPNLVDGADFSDWTGDQTRDQFALHFNQGFNQSTELFSSLTYTDRETVSDYRAAAVRIPLAGSPFFIPGLPVDQVVQYSTLKDGQNRTFSADAETISAVLGVRTLLAGDWEGEAFLNYGRNDQCDSCVTGSINPQALRAQIFAGNINPLSSLPLTAEQASLVYGDSTFESRTELEQIGVKLTGPLVDLPAGPLLAAAGAEYRTETNANRNLSRTGVANQFTQISTYGDSEFDRDIGSVFLELNIPAAERLTLSAAARYDDYSGIGDTTNPKLGFAWEMTNQFTLQGTWGTSFRAPSVTDVNPNAVTSGTASVLPNRDPGIVNGVLPPGLLFPGAPGLTNGAIMLGSNPELVPEEAETWSLTSRFSNNQGLGIDLSYWNIEYDDQILFPGSIVAFLGATPADAPANGGSYRGWQSLIIPVNNPASCNNSDISTADPVLQTFLATLNYDFISSGGDFSTASSLQNDFCKVNVIIDSRIQNVGRVEKQGLDFNVGYAPRLNGDLNLLTQLAVTHYLENDFSTQPGVPAESEIGDLTTPASVFEWSGTAGVTALWRDFDAALVARYLDGMLATGQLGANGLPGPDRNLSSYTQLDVTVGYSMDYGQSRTLDGWRAQLAITNVADEEPDFFVQGDGAWNFKYGLPFGRTYAVQLTTRF